jgi:hypothetical protein
VRPEDLEQFAIADGLLARIAAERPGSSPMPSISICSTRPSRT